MENETRNKNIKRGAKERVALFLWERSMLWYLYSL